MTLLYVISLSEESQLLRKDHQREDNPISSKMMCLSSKCEFDTDGEISDKAALGEKLQMMSFHMQLVHTPVPVQPTLSPSVQTTKQRRKPEKFPRPTVVVDEARERWDNFVLNWTQYKEDSHM